MSLQPVGHREQVDCMYLAYVDDSGSTGNNLQDHQALFQVLGGPIIQDRQYSDLELITSFEVEELVGEELWDSFEFHACDLFHAKRPFDVLGEEKCRSLLVKALEQIRALECPIICGAVDKHKLSTQVYASANPVDIAFRLYLSSLGLWLKQRNPEVVTQSELGIIIADAGNSGIQHALESVFRKNRPKIRVLSPGPDSDLSLHIMDDVYFGNSKNSLGIQLADICAYFVARHLAQKQDAEGFYSIIRDLVRTEVFP